MTKQESSVVQQALAVLAKQIRKGDALASPQAVRDFLVLLLAGKEREDFMVIYLDAQNRVIDSEEMFQGTLTQTSVYPREVVKGALAHNASALFLAHNHPSGNDQPSIADIQLTKKLCEAGKVLEITVLDHIIVTVDGFYSFAEEGLI